MRKPDKKIMLVDDSPIMLRNIKNILDKKYLVLLATSESSIARCNSQLLSPLTNSLTIEPSS